MGEGSKEKGHKVWRGAPESLLSMGPESPRYATANVGYSEVCYLHTTHSSFLTYNSYYFVKVAHLH